MHSIQLWIVNVPIAPYHRNMLPSCTPYRAHLTHMQLLLPTWKRSQIKVSRDVIVYRLGPRECDDAQAVNRRRWSQRGCHPPVISLCLMWMAAGVTLAMLHCLQTAALLYDVCIHAQCCVPDQAGDVLSQDLSRNKHGTQALAASENGEIDWNEHHFLNCRWRVALLSVNECLLWEWDIAIEH